MDHITVPVVFRTPLGADAAAVEVSLSAGWVAVEPAEVGGPALVVDECTWRRLSTAVDRLTSHVLPRC